MSITMTVMKNGRVCRFKNPVVLSGPSVNVDPRTGCPIGTRNMQIDITSNYYKLLKNRQMLGKAGFNWLDGKRVANTKKRLINISVKLLMMDDAPYMKGIDQQNVDYWTAIPSNVKRAVDDLLYMALRAPEDAVWAVS